MANVIKHGNLSAAQGPTIYKWKPYVGGSTETSWEGDYPVVANQCLAYQAAGWETELTANGDNKATLKATLTTDASSVIWQVQEHPIEKNILECTDRPIVANLSTQTKQAIEHSIKTGVLGQLIDENTVSQLDNALKVYNLMAAGVESKYIHTVSVKRTMIVAYQYTPVWTLDNVEKVLSKDQFISQYLVPNYLIPLLPNSDHAIVTDGNGVATFSGYLVHYPTYTTTANNRVQVDQEFVFNKWSAGPTGLYDIVS